MRTFKRILCVFLAVSILFFSINNSYFSPHKMDEVEATGLEIGVAYITVELLIELICAIGIAGLGCALIDNIKDWDWEEIAVDLHDWCRENYDVIDQYVTDGANALKEWALADEWVVIEGGGGSAPQPSPSPDHHGFTKAFRLTAGGIAGGFTLSSILTPLSFIEDYNYWVDSDGNIIAADDPRIRSVAFDDDAIVEIAKAYVNDKVTNFTNGNPLSLTDPITSSLQSVYGSVEENLSGFYGNLEFNNENKQVIRYFYKSANYASYHTMCMDTPHVAYFNGTNLFLYYNQDGVATVRSAFRFSENIMINADGSVTELSSTSAKYISWRLNDPNKLINVPIFTSLNAVQDYFDTGSLDDCVNISRKHNYIDTDDDYGWASTADLSPADLAAANPALADNLNGKDVSISSLVAAINALKEQLEEQNPNIGGSADPVPYPDTPTYTVIVNKVVSDPDIFPDSDSDPGTDPGKDPVTDPDKDPDPGTSTETGKDYTGFLGQIINLLKSILQAIKDFMSWFIIDFDAIKAHLLLALDSLSDFSGFNAFMDIVTDIKGQISDNYDYPVIKMTTPDILLPFFKSSEIILIDFEDYAKYFLMVRLAIKFSLYFGFGLWIIRDIKVAFTLN